eukprot:618620-Lingulodinium_polyedra.AAC.1
MRTAGDPKEVPELIWGDAGGENDEELDPDEDCGMGTRGDLPCAVWTLCSHSTCGARSSLGACH